MGIRRGTFRGVAVLVTAVVVSTTAVLVPSTAWGAGCTDGSTQVVGHQDDDLLFQNPDVLLDAAAGRCLQTIYMTAGDGGFGISYANSRQSGAEAAYAQMLGVANSWTSSDAGVPGQPMLRRTLTAKPNVSLVFVRIPDGAVVGSGDSATGYVSLEKLLTGQISRISTIDGNASYTRNQLVTAVASLAAQQGATQIRTLNYTGTWDDGDHSDHHAAAYITYDANQVLTTDRRLTGYVGYQTQDMASNVSGTNLNRKWAAFDAYADFDSHLMGGTWAYWGERQYVDATSTYTGTLRADAGANHTGVTGTAVPLDGSASVATTFAWSQTSGPAVAIAAPTAQVTSFTPTVPGTYVFSLAASRGGATKTASVTVIVRDSSTQNLARVSGAVVTGSSQNTATGQTLAKAVDGVATGYPVDATKEWATTGGKTSSWIQITWPTPVVLSQVVLYDRPNLSDQATAGTLTFSDGSTVPVPSLANDGTPTPVNIPATTTTSVRYTVTGVSSTTSNVGLAEFEAWGTQGVPPVANAGPAQTATAGATVTLDGSASTVQAGKTATYSWVQSSGPAATLTGANTARPTFAPATAGVYVFTLTVSDGVLSATSTVTITVNAPNRPPVANAGPAQTVVAGVPATLDGTASTDPDGNPITYAWSQVSGTPVTLSSTTAGKPTFTPPAAGTYVFSLTVGDGAATSAPATVTITATPANRPPVADAGADQSVKAGVLVTLDGSASADPDGTPVTFAWTQTSGPAVTLSGASTAKPTFTPSAEGTYAFALTVSDGQATGGDTVTITVGPANRPPTVSAGANQSVEVGATVTLSGTANDPDGDSVSYAWTQTGGSPTLTLGTPSAAQTTFTATSAGSFEFTLTATDGGGLSGSAHVTVTVSPPGTLPPAATAGGAQSVTTGQLVQLDASQSSDPQNLPLSYAWTQTAGTPVQHLSDATAAKPTFTADTPGAFTFRVTVSNGYLTGTADVTITVTQANRAPTADAGASRSMTAGTLLTLDGTGSSDPDGDALTYAWTQISGPSLTLAQSATATATATPSAIGTYVFRLVVSDGTLTGTDDVTITVTPANRAPVARVAATQAVLTGTAVTLDGSASSDPDGDALTYSWTQTGGAAVQLTGAGTASASMTPSTAGTYTFQLTVSDGTASATATTTVTVTDPALSNVARSATATASSQNTAAGQTAAKAIDGVAQGYPTDSTKEWATSGGKAGSWIQLTWPSALTLSKVVLYDRPNSDDQITGGTLTFSDGTSVPVSSLNNSGTASTTTFPARVVTWVRLTVTTVSGTTYSAGLAEFEAWGYLSSAPPVVLPPVANAGADQQASTGSQVTLNGSGSSDPNGRTLTYAWTQSAGPSVGLTGANTARPTFTPAAVGTYTFALTVSNGSSTATASTNVTVGQAPPTPTNIARQATATASSQNTGTGQTAAKAIDGVAQGYPTDSTKEWATSGGKAGSWIQLSWTGPQSMSKVVLYDRPNTSDQITGGTLTFSDGSSVQVGSLNNSGTATTVTFPARTATWVRFTVTTVSGSTANAGLAEFEVWTG
ncbi:MAG: tandem-95 repeat protein [Actinobacteria bacterium]|nr:tandem-95 repeat protein [Actinomycetota bacterium]